VSKLVIAFITRMKRDKHAGAPLTLRLREIEGEHLPHVGGKALNLARMMRAGLPVADGFVITVGSFQRFLEATPAQIPAEENRVGEKEQPSLAALTALGQKMCRRLRTQPIPANTEAAVRAALNHFPDAQLWAVRSSASAEDSVRHSFAGQYDSFLNVRPEEVPRRIRECWLSCFGPRAITYRTLIEMRSPPAMAVIVQQMVPAERAGVLFTADPISGDRNRIVIEGAHGLGDRVVAGEVVPDRIVVERSSLGPIQPPSAEVQNVPGLLDPRIARRLAELGARAEAVLSGPLDIEWAVSGDRIYLLQARPITGPPVKWTDRMHHVWTNMNVGEVLPDVITPMTWSLLQMFLEPLFHSVFGLLGADLRRCPVVDLIGGRVYFHANVALSAVRPFSFLLRGIPKFAQALGGAQIPGAPDALLKSLDLPDLGFRWYRFLPSWPRSIALVLSHSPRRGDAWLKRVQARNDRLIRTNVESMTTPDLARFFTRLVHESFEGWDLLYLVTQTPALLVFEKACHVWLKDPDLAVGYRLFAGLGGIPQAEAGLALWDLAVLAHSDLPTEQAVCSTEHWVNVRLQLVRTDTGRRFLEAWDHFMARHGHHCRSELELYSARWSETPDYILSIVRGYLQGIDQCSPPEAQRQLASERQHLTQECYQKLPNPIQRRIFKWALSRAQKAAVARETWKNEAVRIMALLRRVLLTLGIYLHQRGLLSERDDIFFLSAPEVEQLCSGRATFDAHALIRQRREEYARNRLHQPPPLVVDRFEPTSAAPQPVKAEADVLHGIPVSPGRITGPAKVILRNDDHEQVLPGEVLVAPFTDPAWTPYFVPAAAVVTDLGGILSHGSIVAREYGIPAVTNVQGGTRSIKTGDVVEVDGTRGQVKIVKRRMQG
jgi:pyruvate,water dikinase